MKAQKILAQVRLYVGDAAKAKFADWQVVRAINDALRVMAEENAKSAGLLFRRSAEVVADNVYFGESKRRDGGDTSRPAAPSASAPAHRGSYGGYDNVPQGGSAFSELDDDDGDLPF